MDATLFKTPTMEQVMLRRLSILMQRRQEYLQLIKPTDWRMRLIHKAIYSTWVDCQELGGETALLAMTCVRGL